MLPLYIYSKVSTLADQTQFIPCKKFFVKWLDINFFYWEKQKKVSQDILPNVLWNIVWVISFRSIIKHRNRYNIAFSSNWIWAWKVIQTSQILYATLFIPLVYVWFFRICKIFFKFLNFTYTPFLPQQWYISRILLSKSNHHIEIYWITWKAWCVIYGDEVEGLNYLHEWFR